MKSIKSIIPELNTYLTNKQLVIEDIIFKPERYILYKVTNSSLNKQKLNFIVRIVPSPGLTIANLLQKFNIALEQAEFDFKENCSRSIDDKIVDLCNEYNVGLYVEHNDLEHKTWYYLTDLSSHQQLGKEFCIDIYASEERKLEYIKNIILYLKGAKTLDD